MFYFFEYCVVMLLLNVLALLPRPIFLAMVRFLGTLAYFILGRRRRIVRENLEKAFSDRLSQKEKNRISLCSFQNMALSLADMLMVQKICPLENRMFQTSGLHHVEDAFAKGKGVVLVMSHLGSWEYLSFICHFTNRSWSPIVKTIKNPYFNRRIDRLRRSMGIAPMPKRGSIKTVLQKLRANGAVAILIDQWAGSDGLWLDFFGDPTSTTSLPARLALKTGCALVPAACLRTGNGHYEIQAQPALENLKDEAEVTARLNRLLEQQILKYPEQWIWTHRRWKPKPKEKSSP